ncbi:enoyl-CoA hydratase/isomerase family protein [Thalassospiraceae bacterium LMO-SO8]|nr:enoyl-CoA hydratase/isomerase family protein [Alphaproteobacteria bacterium LMO-S08]WND76835.1 enoyl-CoA hydratase/isomerase family protein [Thalassospiraceae bacterium LMO-SO8]
MSASDRFRVSRDGPVARVTLCQGAEGNTLAPPDMQAIGAAIRAEGSDSSVKLVVVTGEGADFCLGRRIVPGVTPPANARAFRERVADAILGVYENLRMTPVPVLAAVQGRAKGFGCAFAAQADVTIAEDEARFSMPEMDGNLPPTLAISAALPKMPAKAVLDMVLTRDEIDAQTAFHFGLISRVAPKGGLTAATAAYIAKLADRDRDALVAIKEYMRLAPTMDLAGQARYGANLIAVEMTSQDKA